jgi:hypothetical protein
MLILTYTQLDKIMESEGIKAGFFYVFEKFLFCHFDTYALAFGEPL